MRKENSKHKELERKVMVHVKSGRMIEVISVNIFKDINGNSQEFCSYFWNEFGLIGTDLNENIIENYEIIS
jgi:hypothetical protein